MAIAITKDSLTTPDALKTVTPTPDLTNYGGMIDSALSSVTADQTTLQTAQDNNQSSVDRINELLGITKNKTQDTQNANRDAGVNDAKLEYDKYSQQLNDINANITGLSNEAKAIPLLTQENNRNTGATDRGVAPQDAGALRLNAIKALTQSSLASAVTASINNSVIKYNQAKEKAQQAIDLKYQPIETEIANLKTQLELNQKYITDPAEKRIADKQKTILDERTRQLEVKKQTEKDVNAIALEIAKNGGDASIVEGATSVADAISKAGNALKTPSTEIVKLGDNQAYLIDKNTGKIIRSFGGGGGGTGSGVNVSGANGKDYAGVVNTILASGKFTKDQANQVRNAINNGEDPFTVVKNNAKNIMSSTEATNLGNLETAKSAMQDLQSQLAEFYAKGGKTSYFTGNYEKTINKLGAISDPNLVDLSVQIQSTLMTYRNAVSGTAYSEKEGEDIASIFPGINKVKGLNDSIIKGRLKAFDSTIDGKYRTALGTTYDKLKTIESKNSIEKGGTSDSDFVAKAFTIPANASLGNYESVVNATPAGNIPVVENSTGIIWYVTPQEYNQIKYTKL